MRRKTQILGICADGAAGIRREDLRSYTTCPALAGEVHSLSRLIGREDTENTEKT